MEVLRFRCMSRILLTRPLEDYFSHAEIAPTASGRRFAINFHYLENGKADRLQWWWQVNAVLERHGGDAVIESARQESIGRFRAHIETWLINTQRCLRGGDPFPIADDWNMVRRRQATTAQDPAAAA
jgi:hypothetical protein